jgi:hypothetical protein
VLNVGGIAERSHLAITFSAFGRSASLGVCSSEFRHLSPTARIKRIEHIIEVWKRKRFQPVVRV